MKRIISILLAILMVTAMFTMAACGNDTPDEPNAPDTPDTPTDPVTPEDPTASRIPLDLPERYYGRSNGDKEQFHIVEWSVDGSRDTGGWIPWHEGDASDEDEDLMGKAVFARNAYVEEKYGVDITQEYVDVNGNAHVLRVQQDNQTGDNGIQLVTTRAFHAWAFISTGLLHDMADIGEDLLHFDQPWWVQDAVKSYSLGNSLYVSSTEMLLRDKGATAAMYFNPVIAENYGIGDLYQIAAAGEWTYETMISSCDIVATSLDGDDLLNSRQDLWGMMNGDDISFYLFASMGEKFGVINDDGYLEYTFGDADSILTMQKIFEEVMYAEWFNNTHTSSLPGEGGGFVNDLALYMASMIKTANSKLREMETSYGVLPMPKADSLQEDYCSLVWIHHDSVLGIPSAVWDPEMACIILEALSYEGYYTVTPVLIETLIYGRLAKTEEAKNSFETIFNSRVYDAGQFWNTGYDGLIDGTESLLRHTKTGNASIMTVWERYRSSTEARVKDVNAFIDNSK